MSFPSRYVIMCVSKITGLFVLALFISFNPELAQGNVIPVAKNLQNKSDTLKESLKNILEKHQNETFLTLKNVILQEVEKIEGNLSKSTQNKIIEIADCIFSEYNNSYWNGNIIIISEKMTKAFGKILSSNRNDTIVEKIGTIEFEKLLLDEIESNEHYSSVTNQALKFFIVDFLLKIRNDTPTEDRHKLNTAVNEIIRYSKKDLGKITKEVNKAAYRIFLLVDVLKNLKLFIENDLNKEEFLLTAVDNIIGSMLIKYPNMPKFQKMLLQHYILHILLTNNFHFRGSHGINYYDISQQIIEYTTFNFKKSFELNLENTNSQLDKLTMNFNLFEINLLTNISSSSKNISHTLLTRQNKKQLINMIINFIYNFNYNLFDLKIPKLHSELKIETFLNSKKMKGKINFYDVENHMVNWLLRKIGQFQLRNKKSSVFQSLLYNENHSGVIQTYSFLQNLNTLNSTHLDSQLEPVVNTGSRISTIKDHSANNPTATMESATENSDSKDTTVEKEEEEEEEEEEEVPTTEFDKITSSETDSDSTETEPSKTKGNCTTASGSKADEPGSEVSTTGSVNVSTSSEVTKIDSNFTKVDPSANIHATTVDDKEEFGTKTPSDPKKNNPAPSANGETNSEAGERPQNFFGDYLPSSDPRNDETTQKTVNTTDKIIDITTPVPVKNDADLAVTDPNPTSAITESSNTGTVTQSTQDPITTSATGGTKSEIKGKEEASGSNHSVTDLNDDFAIINTTTAEGATTEAATTNATTAEAVVASIAETTTTKSDEPESDLIGASESANDTKSTNENKVETSSTGAPIADSKTDDETVESSNKGFATEKLADSTEIVDPATNIESTTTSTSGSTSTSTTTTTTMKIDDFGGPQQSAKDEANSESSNENATTVTGNDGFGVNNATFEIKNRFGSNLDRTDQPTEEPNKESSPPSSMPDLTNDDAIPLTTITHSATEETVTNSPIDESDKFANNKHATAQSSTEETEKKEEVNETNESSSDPAVTDPNPTSAITGSSNTDTATESQDPITTTAATGGKKSEINGKEDASGSDHSVTDLNDDFAIINTTTAEGATTEAATTNATTAEAVVASIAETTTTKSDEPESDLIGASESSANDTKSTNENKVETPSNSTPIADPKMDDETVESSNKGFATEKLADSTEIVDPVTITESTTTSTSGSTSTSTTTTTTMKIGDFGGSQQSAKDEANSESSNENATTVTGNDEFEINNATFEIQNRFDSNLDRTDQPTEEPNKESSSPSSMPDLTNDDAIPLTTITHSATEETVTNSPIDESDKFANNSNATAQPSTEGKNKKEEVNEIDDHSTTVENKDAVTAIASNAESETTVASITETTTIHSEKIVDDPNPPPESPLSDEKISTGNQEQKESSGGDHSITTPINYAGSTVVPNAQSGTTVSSIAETTTIQTDKVEGDPNREQEPAVGEEIKSTGNNEQKESSGGDHSIITPINDVESTIAPKAESGITVASIAEATTIHSEQIVDDLNPAPESSVSDETISTGNKEQKESSGGDHSIITPINDAESTVAPNAESGITVASITETTIIHSEKIVDDPNPAPELSVSDETISTEIKKKEESSGNDHSITTSSNNAEDTVAPNAESGTTIASIPESGATVSSITESTTIQSDKVEDDPNGTKKRAAGEESKSTEIKKEEESSGSDHSVATPINDAASTVAPNAESETTVASIIESTTIQSDKVEGNLNQTSEPAVDEEIKSTTEQTDGSVDANSAVSSSGAEVTTATSANTEFTNTNVTEIKNDEHNGSQITPIVIETRNEVETANTNSQSPNTNSSDSQIPKNNNDAQSSLNKNINSTTSNVIVPNTTPSFIMQKLFSQEFSALLVNGSFVTQGNSTKNWQYTMSSIHLQKIDLKIPKTERKDTIS